MISRAQVFKDQHGNRFIIPSHIVNELEKSMSASSAIMAAMTLSSALGSAATLEKEWLEFDLDAFPHVVSEMAHRCFFHGAATVYLFDGPVFEQIKKETAA